MRILKIVIGIALLNAICYTANAQGLTQVVRGQVIDIESQIPLAFASIAVITTSPVLGSITDDNGNFRLEKVPIGRHDIKVAYMGYETQVIPELMVSTGKELVLTIKMKEQITELEVVSVKAYTKKDKPLNSMATVSARTFSVEEARRYAGGFDDPVSGLNAIHAFEIKKMSAVIDYRNHYVPFVFLGKRPRCRRNLLCHLQRQSLFRS